MKIRVLLLLTLTTLLAAGQLAAADDAVECVRPEAPGIPDGRRVPRKEIMEAKKLVEEYLAASLTYRECLTKQISKLDKTKHAALIQQIEDVITDSVETDFLVGDMINHEIRVYRAIHE